MLLCYPKFSIDMYLLREIVDNTNLNHSPALKREVLVAITAASSDLLPHVAACMNEQEIQPLVLDVMNAYAKTAVIA
jgi:hypothetical protein